MKLETTRCVVLNSTYEPISVVTSKRALLLVLEGKAVVVEEHPELVVRSPSQVFKIPVMIALKNFVKARKIFKTSAVLTQRNLFVRDNHTCQYCNRHRGSLKHTEFLTRDHIIPQTVGGKSTWENLVTACSSCNGKKGSRMLQETGMVLIKLPKAPTLFELWMRNTGLNSNTKKDRV